MINEVVSSPQRPHQVPSILRRRSSISGDLELLSIAPASRTYTSLRDLLPTVSAFSPSPCTEICIRNRLVKQAAIAYLQPMSTSPGPAGGCVFHRLWPRVAAFIDLIRRSVARAVNLWVRSPGCQRVV